MIEAKKEIDNAKLKSLEAEEKIKIAERKTQVDQQTEDFLSQNESSDLFSPEDVNTLAEFSETVTCSSRTENQTK